MNLQFEEEALHVDPQTGDSPSFLVNFCIKMGIANNTRSANVIIGSVAMLFFAISIWLIIYANKVTSAKPPTVEEATSRLNNLQHP